MSEEKPTCLFIKKRSRQAVRQKKESSSSEEDAVEVKRKTFRSDSSALYQTTSRFLKRSTFLSEGDEDQEDESLAVSYKASRSLESSISREKCATASLEIDTDVGHDAQAVFEKSQQINKELASSKGNIYRGLNNYVQYIEKKDTVMGNASSGFNRKGPMRAPSNLRATVRWDYQPDICKDYKETGFCSFGDSCKFLHDRSDYKHGWQIDQELAEGTYGIDGTDNRYEIVHNSSEEELEEDIPPNCIICRKEYRDPVVTNCRHYFCGDCALKRYKKTARCYACMADTRGFFKFAKDLYARLDGIRRKRRKVKDDFTDDNDNHPDATDEHQHSASSLDRSQPLEEDQHACSASHQYTQSCSSSEHSEPPKIKLPIPAEPKWAEPEAPEYCNSSEESD